MIEALEFLSEARTLPGAEGAGSALCSANIPLGKDDDGNSSRQKIIGAGGIGKHHVHNMVHTDSGGDT